MLLALGFGTPHCQGAFAWQFRPNLIFCLRVRMQLYVHMKKTKISDHLLRGISTMALDFAENGYAASTPT